MIGIQRTAGDGRARNEPGAIVDAARYLQFGDVIVLEMQTGDVNNDLGATGVLDAQHEAIRFAIAKGITITEPVGNGRKNG